MKLAPYLAVGAVALAFASAPATAAAPVSPTAANQITTGTDSKTLTLVEGRGHRGHRGRGHHRGNRGHHRGNRGHHRGNRGHHRGHRGQRRGSWHGHGDGWRRHRHHGHRHLRRHIRHGHFHRGRFHHHFWGRGATFGFWLGVPLYYYNHLGYDCHRVTVRDYWRGQYALIGGTLCYDELGYPYLYRRWLIRYLY